MAPPSCAIGSAPAEPPRVDWLKRERDTRALRLTAIGRKGLAETFGVALAGVD
jgi:hypothetical protein